MITFICKVQNRPTYRDRKQISDAMSKGKEKED